MWTEKYRPDPKYQYSAITSLSRDIKDGQLKLIQPGDIYLVRGKTAIIATFPDNRGNITALQFSRNIDSSGNGRAGGGTYDYILCEQAKEAKVDIYILRPTVKPLHESCPLSELLERIDSKYFTLFPDGATNISGDCRIFFEGITGVEGE